MKRRNKHWRKRSTPSMDISSVFCCSRSVLLPCPRRPTLYVPDFMWICAFLSFPCLFHTCNKNNSCHSIVSHSESSMVPFHFVHSHELYNFVSFYSIRFRFDLVWPTIWFYLPPYIFWCAANMSSNVSRYGRVRLEIKLISTIHCLSIKYRINQRANVAQNVQITFELRMQKKIFSPPLAYYYHVSFDTVNKLILNVYASLKSNNQRRKQKKIRGKNSSK